MLGVMCGAICAFLLSRHLFKDQIKKQIAKNEWLSRNFKAIDEVLLVSGITIVALLRLTFAPFAVSCYVLGVTSIALFDYIIGSLSYVLNEAMQVFIGCSLYTMQKSGNEGGDNKTQVYILIVEIILTVAITLIMGFYANKLVKEKLEMEGDQKMDDNMETQTLLSEGAEKWRDNLSKGIPSDASTTIEAASSLNN